MSGFLRRATRSRAVALATAGLTAAGIVLAVAPPGSADDSQPLTFVRFLHKTDLTPNAKSLQGAGFDPGLGVFVVSGVADMGPGKPSDIGHLWTLDAGSLQVRDSIPAPLRDPTTLTFPGRPFLDPDRHVVYVGQIVSSACATANVTLAPNCDSSLVPGAGDAASAAVSQLPGAAGDAASAAVEPEVPQVAAVDLAHGDQAGTASLPASAAGMSVAAMAPLNLGDRHLLYVLVNNPDYSGVDQAQGFVHNTALYELDADKLLAGDDDPVVWEHDVPSCGALTGSPNDYLGVDPGGRFAYFDCTGSHIAVGGATFVPAGAVVVDFPQPAPTAEQEQSGEFTDTYYPAGAPLSKGSRAAGDPAAGLLVIGAADGSDNKLYVFDAQHRAWTGSVPAKEMGANLWSIAVNPANGEIYTFGDSSVSAASQITALPVRLGGTRSLGDAQSGSAVAVPLVDPATNTLLLPGQAGAWEHTDGSGYGSDVIGAVYRDDQPFDPVDNTPADPDELTHDVDITADTPVSYQAIASGYGLRAVQVGGIDGTAAHQKGLGPLSAAVDPGNPANTIDNDCRSGAAGAGQDKSCAGIVPSLYDGSRALTFAVADASTQNSGVSGDATPYQLDSSSQAEFTALTTPATLFEGPFGVLGQDPPEPPSPPDPPDQVSQASDQVSQQSAPATCQDFGGSPQQTSQPSASAECDAEARSASVAATSPGVGAGTTVQVAHASTTVTKAVQTDNLTEVEVTSEADGIVASIPSGPTLRIGSVITRATTAAGGRPGTATATFTRTISNLTVTDPSGKEAFACGFESEPSCDPRQVTDALNEQSPLPVRFVMKNPDAPYGGDDDGHGHLTVHGSPGGAQAAITKNIYDYFNDQNINGDASVEVPGLQLILVGDQAQPSRFVFEFAGVFAQSGQGIDLPPPPPPELPNPSLTVTLTDGATPPALLAGGQFSLVADDGRPAGTCQTAADGIGSCTFKDLTPGSYTITETKAPPGYAKAPDYPLSLDAGQDYTATFVNLAAIGSVHVLLSSAVDQSPVAGGTFALYSGKSTLRDPVATCTTDKKGACGFDKVPLGDYTVAQKSAPKGFLTGDPVSFGLTDPGQDATLTFVDGTPGAKGTPASVDSGTPQDTVVGGTPVAVPASFDPGAIPPLVSAEPSATAPLVAGLPAQISQLPAQLARLLTHSPQQAVLLLFVWLVLGLPAYLWVRRRQLLTATEGA